eukprot:1179221-Prorocentrum_minimum.AAC.2
MSTPAATCVTRSYAVASVLNRPVHEGLRWIQWSKHERVWTRPLAVTAHPLRLPPGGMQAALAAGGGETASERSTRNDRFQPPIQRAPGKEKHEGLSLPPPRWGRPECHKRHRAGIL